MKAAAFAIALVLVAAPGWVHSGEATHKAVGVVKKVDPQAGTATLAHEPVKSMKWPSMTMAFQVKDKAVLDKLAEGKKVEFEFEQRGKDYVITSAK